MRLPGDRPPHGCLRCAKCGGCTICGKCTCVTRAVPMEQRIRQIVREELRRIGRKAGARNPPHLGGDMGLFRREDVEACRRKQDGK